METLEELLPLNVFYDITFNPPSPFTDLQANMTESLEALRNKSYNNTNEFYSDIATIFNRQKDPHSVFYKPCGSAFSYVLPYTFQAWKDDDDSYVRIKLMNQSSKYSGVTEKYLSESGSTTDYVGWEVVRLSYNSSSLDETDEHAAETIAHWADENVYYSKLQITRFNRATYADFAVRSQKLFNIPETSTISVRLQEITSSGESGETVDVTIPWYGYANSNMTELADVCGVANNTSNAAEPSETALRRLVRETDDENERTPVVTNDDELTQIFADEACEFYIWESENAGFMPSNYSKMSDFIQEMYAALSLCNTKNLSRLIVDVRGNGGGYVALGMRTLEFLHHNLYPVLGKYGL